MDTIIAVTGTSAHRLQEIGVGVAGLGAVVLIVAGILGLGAIRRDGNRESERYAVIAAGLLLGVGLLLQLLGLHKV